jgi:hypothetical protein
MESPRVRLDFRIAAAWADNELRPSVLREIELTGVVIREHRLEVPNRHLMDALFGGHAGSPVRAGEA